MEFRARIQPWIDWLRQGITDPRSELTRWQRAARFTYDLGRYGARQLRQDKAPQMAGALAFRTLFSLVPVLVVGTLVVRAVRGSEQMTVWLSGLFTRLGLDEYQLLGGPGGEVPTAGSETISQWLLTQVARAQEVNLAAIGWIGLGVLIYAAIGLMVTIENSFNTIYRAPSGRAWTRRLTLYWTVLTLSPAAMAILSYVNARWSAWLEQAEVWPWLAAAAPRFSGFVGTFIVLFAVYRLVPNTQVAVRPAVVGAFVTAVLVEIGRGFLGAYLENMMSLQMLYGSLGLAPFFMFWVYIMWLVVLFGLEVAATLQMLGGRRLEEIEQRAQPTGVVEPAAAVLVMEIVAEAFERGQPASARHVAEAAGIPEPTVRRMLDALARAGFVHRLERDESAVTLARPPLQIGAEAIMSVGYALVETGVGARRSELVERLRQAQRTLAAQVTLAGALKPAPSSDR
jgi:membrane protein